MGLLVRPEQLRRQREHEGDVRRDILARILVIAGHIVVGDQAEDGLHREHDEDHAGHGEGALEHEVDGEAQILDLLDGGPDRKFCFLFREVTAGTAPGGGADARILEPLPLFQIQVPGHIAFPMQICQFERRILKVTEQQKFQFLSITSSVGSDFERGEQLIQFHQYNLNIIPINQ